MKVANIETFMVYGGWRPWIYVKIETDEGITGYGECTDPRSPHGVVGTIQDLTPVLIGQDPRAFEMRFWDMLKATRQSPGGIAAKAVAGIDSPFSTLKPRPWESPSLSCSAARPGIAFGSTGPIAAPPGCATRSCWACRRCGRWKTLLSWAGRWWIVASPH